MYKEKELLSGLYIYYIYIYTLPEFPFSETVILK